MIKKLCTPCRIELSKTMNLAYMGKRNHKSACDNCGRNKYVTEYKVTESGDMSEQTASHAVKGSVSGSALKTVLTRMSGASETTAEKKPNSRITAIWDIDLRTAINIARLADRWDVTQGEVVDSVVTAFMRRKRRNDEGE